jgi:hypothetical protein
MTGPFEFLDIMAWTLDRGSRASEPACGALYRSTNGFLTAVPETSGLASGLRHAQYESRGCDSWRAN